MRDSQSSNRSQQTAEDDHIQVRVVRVPGTVVEVALNGDRTVAAALTAAGLSAEGYEVQVNGTRVTNLTAGELEDEDTVLLSKKIKGN